MKSKYLVCCVTNWLAVRTFGHGCISMELTPIVPSPGGSFSILLPLPHPLSHPTVTLTIELRLPPVPGRESDHDLQDIAGSPVAPTTPGCGPGRRRVTGIPFRIYDPSYATFLPNSDCTPRRSAHSLAWTISEINRWNSCKVKLITDPRYRYIYRDHCCQYKSLITPSETNLFLYCVKCPSS